MKPVTVILASLALVHCFFKESEGGKCVSQPSPGSQTSGCIVRTCPDYYWRDYNDTLPPDAIEGGRDAASVPFYVGQAYFRNKELLPASIYNSPQEKLVRASAYNKVMTSPNNVKVLCSPHKNSFKWIHTKSEDLQLLVDDHLVVGGSEVGQTLYIGRVKVDDRVVLGKVFQHSQNNRGLWTPNLGGTENNYQLYQVLVHSCQDQDPDIDARSNVPCENVRKGVKKILLENP